MIQLVSLIKMYFRDNDGAEASCQLNFPVSVSPSTLWSVAPSFAGLFQAVSSAVCIGVDVVIQFKEAPIGTPDLSSNVRRSGVFIFENTALTLATFRVPSIEPSFIVDSGAFAGIEIDITISAVDAVITLISGGIMGVQPCDVFAVDLSVLSSAFVEQY